MRKLKSSTDSTPTVTPVTPDLSGPMAFTASRKGLVDAIRRLASIAPKRGPMPILSHALIRVTSAGVVLAATDLDTWGIVEAPVWTPHGTGDATVPIKALGDVLRKLPDGDVTIKATERGIEIVSGAVCVGLEGHTARDYPALPRVLGTDPALELTTVNAGTVREMIATVAHAICKDSTRFHLAGIFLEYDGTTARMVATDGHRLAKAERELARTGDFATKGMIIPAAATSVLHKLLAKGGECSIGMVGDKLAVRYMGTTLVIKLTDAQFPPYAQVIPTDYRRLITVDRAALTGAMDRSAMLCSATRGVRLEATDGKLVMVSDNPDAGETREYLAAELNPSKTDTFRIGVDPRYLRDALAALDGERVTLAFSADDSKSKYAEGQTVASLAPMLVRSTEHAVSHTVTTSPALVVVMPMRV